MFKKGINLGKALEKRFANNTFPTIHYFITDINNCICDGSVDGDDEGAYLGLLQGKSEFKELIFDENILKDENAILILCEKVLDLHGRLFINIGLLGDKYEGYVDEQENEYDVFYLEDNISTKDVKVLEDYNEYCNGAYGVYIQKDDEGNYQYDYGYQLMELYQCNKPPIERYYPIIGPIFDEIEEGIIEMVDKLELNQ